MKNNAKVSLMPRSFGGFLKAARNSVNLTLEAASNSIRCSKSYIWELENGNGEPSLRIASGIAKAYGLKLETIASYLNEMTQLKSHEMMVDEVKIGVQSCGHGTANIFFIDNNNVAQFARLDTDKNSVEEGKSPFFDQHLFDYNRLIAKILSKSYRVLYIGEIK